MILFMKDDGSGRNNGTKTWVYFQTKKVEERKEF